MPCVSWPLDRPSPLRPGSLRPTTFRPTFFDGKPFTSSTPQNIKYTMVFTADGKMTREPQGKTGVKGEGTWKLSKDGFCTTWKNSAGQLLQPDAGRRQQMVGHEGHGHDRHLVEVACYFRPLLSCLPAAPDRFRDLAAAGCALECTVLKACPLTNGFVSNTREIETEKLRPGGKSPGFFVGMRSSMRCRAGVPCLERFPIKRNWKALYFSFCSRIF